MKRAIFCKKKMNQRQKKHPRSIKLSWELAVISYLPLGTGQKKTWRVQENIGSMQGAVCSEQSFTAYGDNNSEQVQSLTEQFGNAQGPTQPGR